MKLKHSLITGLISILLLSACSEYGKVLKSSDSGLKLTKAYEYFEKKDFDRALPLFEDLVGSGVYRGTEKAERVYYSYAWCHYHLKEFYLAAYYFKMFSKTYPNSVYAEECLFMSAICNVKNSPNWSLDQTETIDAINELQLFLNRFPESRRRDTCNIIMDQMYNKLETKAFENAYLYYKIENYKAASIALTSMVDEYPNSRYVERAMYLIVKSDYLLAMNSIESKKLERFEQTLKSYTNFVSLFPQSTYRKELEGYQQNAAKLAELLKKKTGS
ncbi:MAG TPA: outer membrane protein assembly factor BamD [Flavobacteriales bacterium]|nr:outer membrane protein assembly factor BamD [Flavobacteriales bacterium]HRE98457.1 outer membrane protein assembly factor BamD [Flavobacteriales bacterium]HRJ35557.1 outer membrane protein assembly factor BamD [Flavobacteriales bacterium]HRJ40159.1 outer membrane protein assembly factor BamD [Flavobacteriales bacterium]